MILRLVRDIRLLRKPKCWLYSRNSQKELFLVFRQWGWRARAFSVLSHALIHPRMGDRRYRLQGGARLQALKSQSTSFLLTQFNFSLAWRIPFSIKGRVYMDLTIGANKLSSSTKKQPKAQDWGNNRRFVFMTVSADTSRHPSQPLY